VCAGAKPAATATPEKDIGAVIVNGKKLEPHPLEGFPPPPTVVLPAAHDGDYLYLRAQ
jgi:hypothetical protein